MTTATRRAQIANYVEAFAFQKLFIEELGWDRYHTDLAVEVNGTSYLLHGVAQKRGVVALVCDPDARGGVPDYANRQRIEAQVTRSLREHLIIFVDKDHTQQHWLWVRRKPGQPTAYRGEQYYKGQSGGRLIQKLQQIAIDMADEETLSHLDVTLRMEKGFDVERVTKRFYDRFQTEHKHFVQAITGIADDELRAWYASLMLNRLMFVYFIQQKSFLDGDINYLPNKLRQVQERFGHDQFHAFYREFLLHFFHDGLGRPESDRSPAIRALIGRIPYVNGGLFEEHAIERSNPSIAIPDAAFERIFAFFGAYSWHLDDRPLRADNEINPDVLGYIFEKYINQKQMGAYYTKEDITGYIGRNTILPFLFDQAREKCGVAFQSDGEVWRLLRDDPDRYIYDAVRKGVDEPLPPEIAAGLDDVSKRGGWNRPAPETFALPTETWREHVARRTRCLDLRRKLASGEMTQVNDLITYNLDIERFARDVIERCEGPELLRAFWQAATSVTILDPTCGSGAFLFAALNILEPLYEACLDRMRAFVDDFDRLGERQKGPDFREVLARVAQHPNRRYFILKTIIIKNLYGVDIMAEACEIAKLRLFLKLVSQVDTPARLEPLPDIDFNIRSGNTLVGFTTIEAVRQAMTYDTAGRTRKLLLDLQDEDALKRINEQAEIAGRAYQQFQNMQAEQGMDAAAFHTAKAELEKRLGSLRDELDRYLAREYGIAAADDLFAFGPWRANHQPFQWFVEFYGIVQERGGFDVIIGNPPYVEYSKVRQQYRVLDYDTVEAGNLLAFVVERSTELCSTNGSMGLIVQLSAFSTPRMATVNELVNEKGSNYISFYECRPGKLFDGVDIRLAIWLRTSPGTPRTYATRLNRFPTEYRPHLLQALCYSDVTRDISSFVTPKVSTNTEVSIYEKLMKARPIIGAVRTELPREQLYYSYGVRYWARVLDHRPYYKSDITDTSTGEKVLSFVDPDLRDAIVCVMSSSLFFWFYCVTSDGHNFTKTVIDAFPLGVIERSTSQQLRDLCHRQMGLLEETATIRKAYYKTTGNIEYKEYSVSDTKAIIDEIDGVLARHYGFTDEELDFIINYDIKYRMGQENGSGDDGESDGEE